MPEQEEICWDLGYIFIVEPGNIHIRIANWAEWGIVSGTPINDDYNRCIIEQQKKWIESVLFKIEVHLSEMHTYMPTNVDFFLEKYAQYPDVVRFHLSFC